ncbi:MAG: metallophosphoesterase [Aliidongia sp.]
MSWPANAAKPLGRRSVLKAAGGLAASVVLPAVAAEAEPLLRLRLLETSDLHMFIYDYDYYRDRPDETVGLAKTATLIDEARVQVKNSLLFDNGDIIQGNPLGDYLAGHKSGGAVHPMFRAMNLLGYDAATLGNHEFNYGLDFLQQALAGAAFPFVCANLDHAGGASFLPPSLVLERDFIAEDGTRHRLKIGRNRLPAAADRGLGQEQPRRQGDDARTSSRPRPPISPRCGHNATWSWCCAIPVSRQRHVRAATRMPRSIWQQVAGH